MPWNKNTQPWLAGMAVFSAARFTDYFPNLPSTRNILPEPFDVPDHIGNTGITFAILYPFMARLNATYSKKNGLKAETEEEYKVRRVTTIAIASTLTIAANVFAETVGYGSLSTPDITDFAYGMFGGILAYKATKRSYIPPEEVNVIIRTEEPDLEGTRKRVREIILDRAGKQPASWPSKASSNSEQKIVAPARNQPKKPTRQNRSSNRNRKH